MQNEILNSFLTLLDSKSRSLNQVLDPSKQRALHDCIDHTPMKISMPVEMYLPSPAISAINTGYTSPSETIVISLIWLPFQ